MRNEQKTINSYQHAHLFYEGEEYVGMAGIITAGDHTLLVNFWVEPQFRQQGYGKKIMDFITKYENPLKIIATPHEDSIPANKLVEFYCSYGYEEIGKQGNKVVLRRKS